MPRFSPVTGKADLAPEYAPVVEAVEGVFGNVRGPMSVLLHSPELAQRALPLVTFFREQSVVEDRLKSVAILTFVRERESPYVWSAQSGAARRGGLSDEAIDVIRSKGDGSKLPEDERQVLEYARQLATTNHVDEATFGALRDRYGIPWLVELTAAANFFALFSGMTNAFDVQAPPDAADRLPAS